MSFSADTKLEITQHRLGKPCCVRAAAYGAACFSKYFDARGMVLQTEHPKVVQYVQRLLRKCGVTGTVTEKVRPSGSIFEYAVKEPEQISALHQLFGVNGSETSLQIRPELLVCPDCVPAFVSAAFLCAGTMTDPEKGYTMEFLTPRFNLSRDLEGLLAEHHFAPHRTQRKGVNVVYIKSSGRIEELLAYMKAPKASMRIMDQKAFRSMRNTCNRLNNCETANMQKSIDANAATLRAIQYLRQHGAMEGLPEPLLQAAEQRCSHPELSLAQLAACFEPPISKSGLAHRLRKLETLAADLKARAERQERTDPDGE